MQLRFSSGKLVTAEPELIQASSVLRAWAARASVAPFEMPTSEDEWALCLRRLAGQTLTSLDDAVAVFQVGRALDLPALVASLDRSLHIRCNSSDTYDTLAPDEWLQSRLFVDYQRESDASVVWDLAPSISEEHWRIILEFLRVPQRLPDVFQALPSKIRTNPDACLSVHLGEAYHTFVRQRLDTLDMPALLKLGVAVAELHIPNLTQVMGCVMAKRVYAQPRAALADVFGIDPKYRNATIEQLHRLDRAERWTEAIAFLKGVDTQDVSHGDAVAENQN